jgi:pimeloyl-ACP methyl ester carboxylesterase
MDLSLHRVRRRPLAILFGAVTSAIVLACSFQGCNPTTGAQLTICAVDSAQNSDCSAASFAAHTIAAGDFRTLSSSQTIKVLAVDSTQHPLTNLALQFSVTGANANTATVQSDANGIAAFSYSGTHAGTDTIKVTPTSSSVTVRAAPQATVHWLQSQTFAHPIIFLHGINEDANVIKNQQEWSALFEALDATYDRADIETFCYVDDRAYLDVSPPPHCPAPGSSACSTNCVSQSAVDDNAVELAKRVSDLHTRTGKLVTLMGYSMGTAIIRSFLAGLPFVDKAFFLNGVQQGSWLMTVKQGLDDAANLSGDGIPPSGASAFFSVLPALEQIIFDTVKARMGLDANGAAATDLTPRSPNIVRHNLFSIPNNVKAYTFYGAVQLTLSVNIFAYHVAGTQPLPLGDLVLLAQDNSLMATPEWGGAALCDSCGQADTRGYQQSTVGDQYHAWALMDAHDVNIADIIPGVGQTLKATIGSPVQHLNISQPVAQAPGSGVQVEDITHLSGNPTTDMAEEILLILMQSDGIA